MVKLSDVSGAAIAHYDRDSDFWCVRSYVAFKVWMVCGLSLATAAYDLYCVFLVTRLIGRDRFQDDPFFLGTVVAPGRMPFGSAGIVLSIAFLGALLSQVLVVPLADRYGRKLLLEISLLVMAVASTLSATTFNASMQQAGGAFVVGSLCFWRLFVGLGVGCVYPLAAAMMAEYAPKRLRGAYLALVCTFQGLGLLVAALVALAASAGVMARYPATNPYPQGVDGCSTFTELNSNGINPLGGYLRIFPCPVANQQAYAQQLKGAAPVQVEYIWRAVVSGGGFGALVALVLSRLLLTDTPRFTAHVLGRHVSAVETLANEADVDYTVEAAAVAAHLAGTAAVADLVSVSGASALTGGISISSPQQTMDKSEVYAALPFLEFVGRYRWPLLCCSMTWCCINVVFVGLLLLLEPVAKYMGFNKGRPVEPAADECFGLAAAYFTACLSALVPGFYLAAVSFDTVGRKAVQFMGFLFMAGLCAACAGAQAAGLLNPNESATIGRQPGGFINRLVGWVVMFALTFACASWGPLTACFTVPAELFPTCWRVTGHSICAAAGSLGSIIGVWAFLAATQPQPWATTYAYPCMRSDDQATYGLNVCLRLNLCPIGRRTATDVVGDACVECINPLQQAGCYPFGLGVSGSLTVMVAILMVGAAWTMHLPLTDQRSLEAIASKYDPYDDDEMLGEEELDLVDWEQMRETHHKTPKSAARPRARSVGSAGWSGSSMGHPQGEFYNNDDGYGYGYDDDDVDAEPADIYEEPIVARRRAAARARAIEEAQRARADAAARARLHEDMREKMRAQVKADEEARVRAEAHLWQARWAAAKARSSSGGDEKVDVEGGDEAHGTAGRGHGTQAGTETETETDNPMRLTDLLRQRLIEQMLAPPSPVATVPGQEATTVTQPPRPPEPPQLSPPRAAEPPLPSMDFLIPVPPLSRLPSVPPRPSPTLRPNPDGVGKGKGRGFVRK